MKSIGGYFEVEKDLFDNRESEWHSDSLKLSSGRGCLSYIINTASIKKIWLPFYCCESVIHPFKNTNCNIHFYEIGEDLLPLINSINAKDDEWILVINYFGMFNTEILINHFNKRQSLIIDNSMAFFADLSNEYWSFNSCRKFFGVPDGAYLKGPGQLISPINRNNPPDSHLFLRAQGKITEGYTLFQKAESLIPDQPLAMSKFSENILTKIDYKKVFQKRIENFNTLHKILKNLNLLNFSVNFHNTSPHYYPFLSKKKINRQSLINNNIFTPKLWHECITRSPHLEFDFSRLLSEHSLFLPIDHRYNEAEMKLVAKNILNQF